jgi:hypothetical protein
VYWLSLSHTVLYLLSQEIIGKKSQGGRARTTDDEYTHICLVCEKQIYAKLKEKPDKRRAEGSYTSQVTASSARRQTALQGCRGTLLRALWRYRLVPGGGGGGSRRETPPLGARAPAYDGEYYTPTLRLALWHALGGGGRV